MILAIRGAPELPTRSSRSRNSGSGTTVRRPTCGAAQSATRKSADLDGAGERRRRGDGVAAENSQW
jgi:hypothetical protein